MDQVNKTLYIPLYGKAYVSRRGVILKDQMAEKIWDSEGFLLKGKSKSKWLAFYMGIRSAVFDRWLQKKMVEEPQAVVLHIGCGLDSRILRVGVQNHQWYDIDFPEVIRERKRYFEESERYHMCGADVRNWEALGLSGEAAIVIMEGVSMYLQFEELEKLISQIGQSFHKVSVLMDCYTEFAAKMSAIRNPINDVGVRQVYGIDDPTSLRIAGLHFSCEHEMTPDDLTDSLQGMEKWVFKRVYGGKMSKRLYRLYEFRMKTEECV